MKSIFYSLILSLILIACASSSNEDGEVIVKTEADLLLDEVLAEHGPLIDFQFDFRGSHYSVEHQLDDFKYIKTNTDSGLTVDVLTSHSFSRSIDGVQLDLSEEDISNYSESLNSVVYFMCLPQKLTDPSVNLTLFEPVHIFEKKYAALGVTFNQEGGGTDFEDHFMYWINQTTNRVDYFAYAYNVNGGGGSLS